MNGLRLIRLLAKTAIIAGGFARSAARENTPDTVCNGTFVFKLINNKSAYEIHNFLKTTDPSVKSVIIPAEYKGVPVKSIGASSFFSCEFLKSVVIADGVEEIGVDAFGFCSSLEKVRLPKSIRRVYESAFRECPLLPAETVMTCLSHSLDITQPFCKPYWSWNKFNWDTALREDVFVLALKYNCFSNFDRKETVEEIIRRDVWKYLRIMDQAGFFSDIERLNGYIDESVINNTPEITAWLLDYKNRKFGFDKYTGDKYEL